MSKLRYSRVFFKIMGLTRIWPNFLVFFSTIWFFFIYLYFGMFTIHFKCNDELRQIRRYVYHDVIRLDDLKKLIDCSYIQVYITPCPNWITAITTNFLFIYFWKLLLLDGNMGIMFSSHNFLFSNFDYMNSIISYEKERSVTKKY